MEIQPGDTVRALAGRDKGGCFYVLETENNMAKIADGKRRRVEKPKLKKLIHLEKIPNHESAAAHKIRSGEKTTNKEIRKALAEYSAGMNGEVNQICPKVT